MVFSHVNTFKFARFVGYEKVTAVDGGFQYNTKLVANVNINVSCYRSYAKHTTRTPPATD